MQQSLDTQPSPGQKRKQPEASTSASAANTTVKKERYRTPDAYLTRPPTTTGAKYYPMPPDCVKGVSDYQENRKRFAARCKKELKQQGPPGLEILRVFWRTDGLAVDWKSNVPIMVDSMRPPVDSDDALDRDVQEIVRMLEGQKRRNAERRAKQASQLGDRPIPNTISSRPLTAVTASDQKDIAPSSEQEGNDVPPEPRSFTPPSRDGPASSPPDKDSMPSTRAAPARPASGLDADPPFTREDTTEAPQADIHYPRYDAACTDFGLAEDWPTNEESRRMTEAAIDFLNRYVSSWDGDRAKLASAYAVGASFSCRRLSRTSNMIVVRTQGHDGFVSGRARVGMMLGDIGSLCMFDGDTPVDLKYDVAHVGRRIGILLTVSGVMHEPPARTSGPSLFTWAFILRDCSEDHKTLQDATGAWPLEIVSHQMTLYHLP